MTIGLFGINQSSRDFTIASSWGKNQFNSSFPAALLCYMQSKKIENIYLKYENGKIIQNSISANDVFGIKWDSPSIFFAFEKEYRPYTDVLVGKSFPIDLVIQNIDTGKYIRALEIKLTAIPDSSTSHLSSNRFGAELVIRTPTIAYITASICLYFKQKRHILRNILGTKLDGIHDWVNPHEVLLKLPDIIQIAEDVCREMQPNQTPLIVQPIWKTKGKSGLLDDNCLDVFVWSDIAFLSLLIERVSPKQANAQSIARPIRTMIWVVKMLFDFNKNGLVNAGDVMDRLSYGPKNDKALSLNGNVTHKYLDCESLQKPRVSKFEIKNIIIGNGVKFLSPERRFDSSIVNDPDLYANS